MDLEDLFKHRKHHQHGKRGYTPHGKFMGHYSKGHRSSGLGMLLTFVPGLLKSKLFWALVVVAVLVMGAIGIALVMALIPLFTGALEFVGENGVKGAVDAVTPYAEKIWYGSSSGN